MPQSLVKKLLGESQDMRFDLNARVEIWVTMEDLEYDRRIEKIKKNAQLSPEQKIVEARKVAQEVAMEKLRDIGSEKGVEITADFDKESVNVDRIDWNALMNPEPEPDEDLPPHQPPATGQAPGAPAN
jgi:hypothetical protein